LIDGLGEILARMDVLDVHENALSPDKRGHVIADTSGIRGGIVAAVADEDIFRRSAFEDFSVSARSCIL